MDVDKVFAEVSVGFFEIESAALTDGTMMPDTGFPGFSTSFVYINGNNFSGTFCLLFWNREIIEQSSDHSVAEWDGYYYVQAHF